MRIAILADPIDRQYGGVHVYARNLVDALLAAPGPHEYILIRSVAEPRIEGAETIVVPRIPGLTALRLFFSIPRMIRRHRIDCVIEPAHFGPFNLPARIARITFIHDMTPVLFPYLHPWMSQMLQRLFFPRILAKADRVITNSEHTTQDVVRLFPGHEDKMVTNHLGIEPFFQPTASSDIPAQYGISEPYILSVATIEPRKNLELLLEAYGRFRTTVEERVQLVIVGKRGWKTDTFFKVLEAHPCRADIILTDYVTRAHLPALYSMAQAFIYPSRYEGFGLPVAEAMQCGTPCVVSSAASLPEVGGDAVLYADPDAPETFCTHLVTLHQDEALREKLSIAGREQARQFTWSRHAQTYLDVFEEMHGSATTLDQQTHPPVKTQYIASLPPSRASLPPTLPRVCIIILNWNRPDDTIRCLASIWPWVAQRQAAVIVCDNASDDDSETQIRDWIAAQAGTACADAGEPWSAMVHQNGTNRGYAAGNNAGIRLAMAEERFDYVWLLNNDTVAAPDALEHLTACGDETPDVGVIGSTIVDDIDRDRIQCAGGCRYFPATTVMLPALSGRSVKEVLQKPPALSLDYISGAAMFIRISALKEIGLLNEQYFLYYEEADLAQRMRRRGHTLMWRPDAIVYHAGARSTGHAATSQLVGYHENRSTLCYTAYYHPLLLPIAAAFRFLGKIMIYALRRRGSLLTAMCRAYADFFALTARPSDLYQPEAGRGKKKVQVIGCFVLKG